MRSRMRICVARCVYAYTDAHDAYTDRQDCPCMSAGRDASKGAGGDLVRGSGGLTVYGRGQGRCVRVGGGSVLGRAGGLCRRGGRSYV